MFGVVQEEKEEPKVRHKNHFGYFNYFISRILFI